ncbi:hypothetical protein AGR8A_pTi20112 [Agrobacterium fabrum str. J-07]|nr:hypothetical protein AGR8A_pTi20112 [Agrobacterium fabrum str. J-07]
MKSADLQIARGDAFVDDPAVPKERFQGRNYTSRCDVLLQSPGGARLRRRSGRTWF